MTYDDWAASILRNRSLSAITDAFVAEGGGSSVQSIAVIDQMPELEDGLPAETAVVRLALDLLVSWTEEWAIQRYADVYVSPPVLVVDDDWQVDLSFPSIYITLASTERRYVPFGIAGRPDAEAPPDLEMQARLRGLRIYRSECGFHLWSSRTWTRLEEDLATTYGGRSREARTRMLATIARNLTLCGAEFYRFRRNADPEILDARLGTINELSMIVADELSRHLSVGGRMPPSDRFVEDLTGTARMGRCEYELICACGVVVWADLSE